MTYVLGTSCWHIVSATGRAWCGTHINWDFAYPGNANDVRASDVPVCRRCSPAGQVS